jgi:RNA polymerase sigma-70 factor (ECF subfamily)
MEIAPAGAGGADFGEAQPEATWVQPIPDRLVAAVETDPGEIVIQRESIRLAFIAALQHLLPRQRAVLILRDVLSWRASEVAGLLDTSEDAVNSTLRRARSAIADADIDAAPRESEQVEREVLGRYVDAFERYDVAALVALLHEDVVVAMPPFELWLRGVTDVGSFLASMEDEGGRDRVIPVAANGSPAVAVWRPDARSGAFQPYALMVLEIADERIISIHAFLDTAIFSVFGLGSAPPA